MALVDALQFEILEFDQEDAREAGAIRALLASRGTPIGPYDVSIAGQAKARGLTLVTRNTSEFRRVAGLRVQDWERKRAEKSLQTTRKPYVGARGAMIQLVGPDGAGKSTVGALLAERLAVAVIDLDRGFAGPFGDIGAFVERHGYDAYAGENVVPNRDRTTAARGPEGLQHGHAAKVEGRDISLVDRGESRRVYDALLSSFGSSLHRLPAVSASPAAGAVDVDWRHAIAAP